MLILNRYIIYKLVNRYLLFNNILLTKLKEIFL